MTALIAPQDWITLGLFLGISLVPGVNADESLNAVIAASVVAGILFVLVIAGLVVFMYKTRGRTKKPISNKPSALPPPIKAHPLAYHQKALTLQVPKVHQSPQGKAFTQHAASPRQRPPVMFYTMNAAPQNLRLNQPDVIPIGPPHPYRPPHPTGQPVVFLDWTGAQRPANGPQITELPKEDDNKRESRHRSKSKESRRKKRARSHSKSKSQTDVKAGEDSGHHSHNETTDDSQAFDIPSNFILTSKDIDVEAFARNMSRRMDREEDFNNNTNFEFEERKDPDTMENFLLERMQTSMKNKPKEQDFVTGDGPFSVTQMRSSYRASGSMSNQDQEKAMTFGDDDDVDDRDHGRPPLLQLHSLTDDSPRPDYSLTRQTVESKAAVVTAVDVIQDLPEPTPRIDYGFDKSKSPAFDDPPEPTPRIDYEFGKFKSPGFDDAPLSSPRSDYRNQLHVTDASGLDDIIAMGSSFRESRPQTQIETGEIEMESVRPKSEVFSSRWTEERSSSRHDFSPMERLDSLANSSFGAPPPPPPPPPGPPPPLPDFNANRSAAVVREKKYRPPTPPPGRIINRGETLDLNDIIGLGENTANVRSAANDVRASVLGQGQDDKSSGSGLPFMDELRKRQKSVDMSAIISEDNPLSMFGEVGDHMETASSMVQGFSDISEGIGGLGGLFGGKKRQESQRESQRESGGLKSVGKFMSAMSSEDNPMSSMFGEEANDYMQGASGMMEGISDLSEGIGGLGGLFGRKKRGEPRRESGVQFARDPPEIIPREDYLDRASSTAQKAADAYENTSKAFNGAAEMFDGAAGMFGVSEDLPSIPRAPMNPLKKSGLLGLF